MKTTIELKTVDRTAGIYHIEDSRGKLLLIHAGMHSHYERGDYIIDAHGWEVSADGKKIN